MQIRFIGAILMLFAAIVFAVIGVRSVPRNNSYVVLGIVFAILAAGAFRRARTR